MHADDRVTSTPAPAGAARTGRILAGDDAERALIIARAILASTLDPIITIDGRGTIREASDAVERVFGWPPSELVGRNISVLMPEPHHSEHDGYLARYRETGRTNILGRPRHFAAVRRDGTMLEIELSVSRVDVPGAHEPLFTGIIRDETERRRTERERHLLHTLGQAIGAAGDLGSAMTGTLRLVCEATGWEYGEAWAPDAGGARLRRAAAWHAGGERLGGFDRASGQASFARGEGLPGRVWVTRRPEWLAPLPDSRFTRAEAARAAGLSAAVALPICSGAEVVAVIVLLGERARAEDRRTIEVISAALATLGSVLERRRALDALAESERRMRDMLQRVELLAVTLDRAGRVISCNDYALRVAGWSRSEALGASWFDRFVPEADRQRTRRMFEQAMSRGEIEAHFENALLTRCGAERLIAWNNTILRDPDGRPAGAHGLGVDVTDQRLAQRELARHRDRLEELVAERTAALESTHAQLRLADRLASIGTLAAGLGHDMNNVLLPMRCRLDALESEPDVRAVRAHHEAIRRSVEYLQQLTDGLHLLALDPDDDQASGEQTDLAAWWGQVGPLLTRAAPSHVSFEVDLPEHLPPVAVPAHRLTQAVLNLIVNAGEAIETKGSIRLQCRTDERTQRMHLAVVDNGHGMSEEVRRRALDPFFTTKKRGLGTGLGLSLVQGVAKAAGGSVEIESQEGRGTTVTLVLPLARQESREEGPPAGEALVSLEDRRIASLTGTLLESMGWRVRYDGSPEGALLWVTNPASTTVSSAAAFAREAGRRLVVLGPAPRTWARLGAVMIDSPDDFGTLREQLAEATASTGS